MATRRLTPGPATAVIAFVAILALIAGVALGPVGLPFLLAALALFILGWFVARIERRRARRRDSGTSSSDSAEGSSGGFAAGGD
jgi:predicted PurR-regulated permease PerM